MITDPSELLYDDDTPDWEIVAQHGHALMEHMAPAWTGDRLRRQWSDLLCALLTRMYRVPDGPERISVWRQICGRRC